MAYNHRNILVGAADLYFGGPDALFPGEGTVPAPDFEAGKSAKTTFKDSEDWEHVGLTSGGVEVTYAPDYYEVEVDQWLDVAKMGKQRQTVTVSTTLAEATLDNLMFAWGQAGETLENGATEADADVLHITAGALGDEPEERQLAFVGKGPGAVDGSRSERVYHLERVLSVESSSHSLSRTDPTSIPVSLRCLPGGGATNADGSVDEDALEGSTYGKIIQRSLTAVAGP